MQQSLFVLSAKGIKAMKEVQENIIDFIEEFNDSSSTLIAIHQCNNFHTQKAGIAKALSTKYPSIIEADKATSYGDINKLGTFSYSKIKPNVYICNLYGQHRYGSNVMNTCYTSLEKGFKSILSFSQSLPNPIFLIPKGIGSGLGGGNQTVILNIIKEVFKDSNVILIYI